VVDQRVVDQPRRSPFAERRIGPARGTGRLTTPSNVMKRRPMGPAGPWDGPHLLEILGLFCYAEHSSVIRNGNFGIHWGLGLQSNAVEKRTIRQPARPAAWRKAIC